MEYKYKIVKDPLKTFMVNKFTAYNQRFVVSESLQNGNTVVAWVDDREPLNPRGETLSDIYFAIINKDGVQINLEDIRANKDGFDTQSWPDIAALPNGNFMIAWSDSQEYVKAGIFYSDGKPLRENNNDFKISPNDSTVDGNYQNIPKIAVINDNRIIITYQKSHNWALGGFLKGIILDLEGNIKVDAFQITQFFDTNPSGMRGFLKWHDTTSLCSGLVATTWMFDNSNNDPTNPGLHDLYIQIYNANGSTQLAIKELQAVGKIDELWPKIIASENCEAVVTWSEPSYDQYYDLYMKRIKYDSVSASIKVLVEKTKVASHYGVNSDYSPVINNYNQDILLTYASGPLTRVYSIFLDKNLNTISKKVLLNPDNSFSNNEAFHPADEEMLFYNSFAQAIVQNQLLFFTSLSSVPWGGDIISQTFNIVPLADSNVQSNSPSKCAVIPKTSASDVLTSLISLGDAFAFSYQKGNPLDVYLGKLTKSMILQKELRMNVFTANDQGGASTVFFGDENIKNQGTIVSIWTSYGQSNPSWWSGYAGIINLQNDLTNQGHADLLVTRALANSVTMAKLLNNRFIVSDHTGCSATECGHLFAHIYSKSGVLERDIEVYNGAAESSRYPGYGVGEYRVFSLKDGKFGGIWHVRNHDTITGYISLQLFSANGDKFGSVIRVTDNIEGYKEKSFVAALSDGGFVVTYQIHDQIRGYLFDNFGYKRGSEIIFSEPTNSINIKPFAFGLNEGNFIVYWQQSYDQNQNYRITAKLYTNNGIELLKEFHLDSDTESGQKLGSDSFVVANLLAQLDDGTVAIAYSNATAIKVCNVDKLNITNKALVPDLISSNIIKEQFSIVPYGLMPFVTTLSNGNFVLMYKPTDAIYGKIFSRMGVELHSFQITDNVTGEKAYWVGSVINGGTRTDMSRALGAFHDGGFVAVWHDKINGQYNIYGEIFNNLGQPIKLPFIINAPDMSYTSAGPTLSILDDNRFVVAWIKDGIRASILNKDGTIYKSEFQVSTGKLFPTVITLNNNAGFVITFEDSALNKILANIYSNNGNLIKSDIIITTNGIKADAIAVLNGFLVCYQTISKINSYNVKCKSFDSLGNVLNNEIQVSNRNEHSQEEVSIRPLISNLQKSIETSFVTTTIFNWPDAIKCGIFLLVQHAIGPTGSWYYNVAGATVRAARFNPDGSYSGNEGESIGECVGKSISQLYADGKAIGFVSSKSIDGTGMTTIVKDWPDAIKCGIFLLVQHAIGPTGSWYYNVAGATIRAARFNPDGSYSENEGEPIGECVDKSISQLYAMGNAINFVTSRKYLNTKFLAVWVENSLENGYSGIIAEVLDLDGSYYEGMHISRYSEDNKNHPAITASNSSIFITYIGSSETKPSIVYGKLIGFDNASLIGETPSCSCNTNYTLTIHCGSGGANIYYFNQGGIFNVDGGPCGSDLNLLGVTGPSELSITNGTITGDNWKMFISNINGCFGTKAPMRIITTGEKSYILTSCENETLVIKELDQCITDTTIEYGFIDLRVCRSNVEYYVEGNQVAGDCDSL